MTILDYTEDKAESPCKRELSCTYDDYSETAVYEYGPFGEILRASGPLADSNPFRFSTKFTDEETGLVYYGFRYYDAGTGRWLGRDPRSRNIGEPNEYAFVLNNPMNLVDVLGLKSFDSGATGETLVKLIKDIFDAFNRKEGDIFVDRLLRATCASVCIRCDGERKLIPGEGIVERTLVWRNGEWDKSDPWRALDPDSCSAPFLGIKCDTIEGNVWALEKIIYTDPIVTNAPSTVD